MVSIFDDMIQVSGAEVQRMLPLVDEQRRNEALRYKHLFGQFACLKSWLMLKELLKPLGINDLKMDYNEHGGAAFLGVKKPVVKAHGASNAASFFAAIRQAKAFVEANVVEDIKANIDYMRIRSDSEANA